MRIGLTLVLLTALALQADAASRKKQCRKACGPAIAACRTAAPGFGFGDLSRACKRAVLRRCKEEGLEVCAAFCGDGALAAPEACDGADLGGATCATLGFAEGPLGCTSTCRLDVSACVVADGGSGGGLSATGQATPATADRNDGVSGPVPVPDDGTVQAGAPLAFVDNGDGTITDENTGLMWEKKSDDGGLHDKDTTYPWSGTGTEDTIWDWLEAVNTEGGTGFAGHDDWRIPNLKELLSIASYAGANPVLDPIFDTVCTSGCTVLMCSCTPTTAVAYYWSSTTSAASPTTAFELDFRFGLTRLTPKDFPDLVRAVRGGS